MSRSPAAAGSAWPAHSEAAQPAADGPTSAPTPARAAGSTAAAVWAQAVAGSAAPAEMGASVTSVQAARLTETSRSPCKAAVPADTETYSQLRGAPAVAGWNSAQSARSAP